MRVVVPADSHSRWSIDGTGRNDDRLEDVTLGVSACASVGAFSIRTMLRSGVRLGSTGTVHGQVTDLATTAALACTNLFFSAIGPGKSRSEVRAAMDAAVQRAAELAADRSGWDVRSIHLDGIDFALFTREITEGAVAHADLGWATVAMWSNGRLPDIRFRLDEIAEDA